MEDINHLGRSESQKISVITLCGITEENYFFNYSYDHHYVVSGDSEYSEDKLNCEACILLKSLKE